MWGFVRRDTCTRWRVGAELLLDPMSSPLGEGPMRASRDRFTIGWQGKSSRNSACFAYPFGPPSRHATAHEQIDRNRQRPVNTSAARRNRKGGRTEAPRIHVALGLEPPAVGPRRAEGDVLPPVRRDVVGGRPAGPAPGPAATVIVRRTRGVPVAEAGELARPRPRSASRHTRSSWSGTPRPARAWA